MDWPDTEALIVPRLLAGVRATYPDVDGGTTTPNDLAGTLYLRVDVIGGTDDGLTDVARVDVEAYAPTRLDAMGLARAARTVMRALAGTGERGALVDRVTTDARPARIPYAAEGVIRVVASYSVYTRLQ